MDREAEAAIASADARSPAARQTLAEAMRAAFSFRSGGGLSAGRERLLLSAILFIALAIRLMQAHEGLPYLHHWDEPQVAGTALQMMRSGDLNPHFFNYGSLLIYANLGVDVVHYLDLMSRPEGQGEHLGAVDDIKTERDTGWHWTISHPSFYLWNRALTALFGTASVALVYLIGSRIGGSWAGLIAAGFLACLPAHVEHSAFVTTDVPASFFALAAVFTSLRYLKDRRPAVLVTALASAGLAATTKYNAAVVIAVPLMAFVLASFAHRSARRAWLWAALPVVPAAAFLAGTPYALLDLRKFLIDVGYEVRHYGIIGQSPATTSTPGWGLFAWQWSMVGSMLGVAAATIAFVGFAAILSRRHGWIVVLHPLLYSAYMAGQRVMVERNVVPLYAFAAIGFGTGSALLLSAGAALASLRWRVRRAVVVAPGILVAIVILIHGVKSTTTAWASWTVPEYRTQALLAAARRASGTTPAGGVGVPEEMRPHPLDLERMGGRAAVKPWLDIMCDPSPYAAIVRPARFAGHRGEAVKAGEVLRGSVPAGFRVVETFGRGPLFLDMYSSMPLVEVLVPGGGPEAQGEWGCEARFAPAELDRSVAYREDPNGTLLMLNGGWVATPRTLADPGRRAVVLRASGQGALGEPARLGVSAAIESEGAARVQLAQKTFDLEQDTRDYVLLFENKDEGLVSIRVEFINDYWSPERKEDRNAFLGSIVLLRAREAPGAAPNE